MQAEPVADIAALMHASPSHSLIPWWRWRSRLVVVEIFISLLDALSGSRGPGEPRAGTSRSWQWVRWAISIILFTSIGWWLWFGA